MWRCQFYYEDWQEYVKKNKRGFKTKGEAEAWERDFRQQQQKDLDIDFWEFWWRFILKIWSIVYGKVRLSIKDMCLI